MLIWKIRFCSDRQVEIFFIFLKMERLLKVYAFMTLTSVATMHGVHHRPISPFLWQPQTAPPPANHPPPAYFPAGHQPAPVHPSYPPQPSPAIECGVSYSEEHCDECGDPNRPYRPHLYNAVNVDEYFQKAMNPEIDLRQGPSSPDYDKLVTQVEDAVNENTARRYRHPWQAAIITSDFSFLCSGVLVSATTIVTAASCVEGKTPAELRGRLGQLDLVYNIEVLEPVYESAVSSVVIHPRYIETGGYTYNVALLNLQVPVDFWRFPNIRPICLPSRAQVALAKDSCVVAGWHDSPEKLVTVTLLKQSNYAEVPYNKVFRNVNEVVTPASKPAPTTPAGSPARGEETASDSSQESKPSYSFYQQSYSKILQDACVRIAGQQECQTAISKSGAAATNNHPHSHDFELCLVRGCVRSGSPCFADLGAAVACPVKEGHTPNLSKQAVYYTTPPYTSTFAPTTTAFLAYTENLSPFPPSNQQTSAAPYSTPPPSASAKDKFGTSVQEKSGDHPTFKVSASFPEGWRRRVYFLTAIVVNEPRCTEFGEEPTAVIGVESVLDFIHRGSR
ncbi:unnamed protein product [Notodromas monacha]|uniref:Peptidase S1 domain-containing protein n=1 Tax=Notodromas monacha TaxID=399045 RepID=A0A7R9BC57_9CRUS|nr:unnamed protein product [Notodromas monacha]CAG0912582.1 unnamed protein product [Notodromas monacha]